MVVLITGCRSGFGRLAAWEAARRGHTVYAGLRDVATAPTEFADAGIRVIPLEVTSAADREAAVRRVLSEQGRIDALVNNAGVALGGFLEQVDDDELRRLFEVNVFAVHALTCAVLPAMRRQGRGAIVMVSSMSGRLAMPALGAYAASKFALEGMSEAWRHELGPFGVRVSLVEPGPYQTDIFSRNAREARRARDPDSPYAPYLARFQGELDAATRTAGDPKEVAKRLIDLCEADDPPLRHPMGPRSLMRRVLRHLPFSVLERGVRRRVMS